MSKLKAKDPSAAKPSKPKILIFGKPGVGKTWQALDFPSVYYIDTEGGANLPHYIDKLRASGGVYLGPEDGSLDFPTLIEQVQALTTEKHSYKTLVIDSITKVFNLSVAAEAERLGDKNAFGADKKPAIAHMRRLVAWVNRLDMNVLFIAHSKPEWGTDGKGDRTEIGQTFDCWDKLEYELHLALEILKFGGTRKAKVRKTRLEGFKDGELMCWEYATFAKHYGAELLEAEPETVTLATVDQVTEINRLLGVVKLDPATLDKWKSKAQADSFEDFTTEQAAGVITYLKKQIT